MKTHESHIKSLVEILSLNKYFDILGSNFRIEEYSYEEIIKYIYTMSTCLDAARIMVYGIRKMCNHLFFIFLHLKEIHCFPFDEKLADQINDLSSDILEYYNEYFYNPKYSEPKKQDNIF